MKTSNTNCADYIILDNIAQSVGAAIIVAANIPFCIPCAAGRPSEVRDDRVSCIQEEAPRAEKLEISNSA